MSDETWHGAESPPAGAEHDVRPDVRPAAPDEIPHLFERDSERPDHCRRCGGWPTDTVHNAVLTGVAQASSDYRSKADERPDVEQFGGQALCAWPVMGARLEPCMGPSTALATFPANGDQRPICDDHKQTARDAGWLIAVRLPQDPIADIGASEPPPAARLASFRCGACSYLFTADEDTRVCPRCQTGDRLIETFYGADPEAAEKAAEVLTDRPVVEAGPTMGELREAGVLVALAPIRSRLDVVWEEIARTMVSTVADARAVVQAWMASEYAAGSGELHMAMSQLRRRLGMAPGVGGQIPDPGGPHVNLLHDTVGMMRAEADRLDKVEGSLRADGVARRLREQADYVQAIVGEPT